MLKCKENVKKCFKGFNKRYENVRKMLGKSLEIVILGIRFWNLGGNFWSFFLEWVPIRGVISAFLQFISKFF